MPRQNLNRRKIVAAAINLITQDGFDNFSLQSLSRHLNIKAPSLYSHFKNIDEISIEVYKELLEEYSIFKLDRIGDKTRGEAFIAYANAVREYSQTHPELFKFLLFCPSVIKKKQTVNFTIGTLMEILDQYDISRQEQYHFQRIFRSLLNGFLACESIGAFYTARVSQEESFKFAIQVFVAAVEAAEAKNK